MGGGIGRDLAIFDDRLTRGGPGGRTNTYSLVWSWLNSDSRKPISINTFNGIGFDRKGTWHRDHELTVTYRPQPAMTIAPGLRINLAGRDAQWIDNVTTDRDHYVFAHLNQTTVAFTSRMNYTMTPDLSLEFYAEPFVSGGQYTGFKDLVDGRSSSYAQRYSPFAYDAAGRADFNVKSFRTTNVLRWEYKPGSTLFVVWQQAREDSAADGRFRFGRDFGGVFRAPGKNVFLVKLAYWLNY